MPWWQLAACIAKNDSAKLWFFWLCSNVQTVHFQAQDDVKTISLEETITLYRAPPSVSPPQILQGHGQKFLAATPPTQSCPPSVSPNQQFEVQTHRDALTTTPPPSSVSPPQGGQWFGSTNWVALTTTPPPLCVSPPKRGNGCGLTNQVTTPPHCAFLSNLFHGYLAQIYIDQLSDPENKKCSP